ncbi:winged helix-turn-helix domain-containing protein [Patescibacteria group bacterium]|nr:winged helix-turn-helix domain-containing protein [Patescibacteria group bacterium]
MSLNSLLIFLFGVVVGGFLVWLAIGESGLPRGLRERIGLQKRRKEKRKEKILVVLREKGRITNDEVQELVGVSDATATRYLDELEKERKIVQKGVAKGSYYELSD